MAYETFLDHTCSLFHVRGEQKSPGYSLPASPHFIYADEPDEKDVPCHFAQASSGGTVNTLVQNLPEHAYEDRIKVNFLIDADIRVNDKVLDHRTGFIYYAEIPRTIRNHHKYCWVKREGTGVAI